MRIADLRREKRSVRSIAAELGRSPSTISREIRRNCNSNVKPSHPSYYRPFAAQKRAEMRRPRPKPRRIDQCEVLRDFIQARLEERWSPEQIANVRRIGVSGMWPHRQLAPGSGGCRARGRLISSDGSGRPAR
ncbi:helix-turn-helix domain-containing protein [Planomonospora sp. ID91781]|nr:helix-turn-helix domain-containing protein [Planomonospora sp. ID91781]